MSKPTQFQTELTETKAALVSAETRLKTAADVEFNADIGQLVPKNLEGLYRIAQVYAMSRMVPEHFQGHVEDTLICVQMARRLGCDDLAFLQSSYIVHGKPGIDAKLGISLLNGSGAIRGRIRYEMEHDEKRKPISCFAWCIDAATGDRIEGPIVDAEMVKSEKWDKNAKWQSMPDLMYRYRSAMFLIRTTYPETINGLYSREELEDAAIVEGTARRIEPKTVDDIAAEFTAIEEKVPDANGVNLASTDLLDNAEPAKVPAKKAAKKTEF